MERHMRLFAEVVCVYPSEKVAAAVARALTPDNLVAPKGMAISTKTRGKKVVTIIELDGRLETLIATIDDLLACTQTAEGLL